MIDGGQSMKAYQLDKWRRQRAEWQKKLDAAEEGSQFQAVCRRMVGRFDERIAELEASP